MYRYTEEELRAMAEQAGRSMETFYTQKFVNYTDLTKGTKKYDTEVIAQWCLEPKNLERLKGIGQITRQSPYRVAGHDGVIEQESNRLEEQLAKMLFQKELPLLGKILDYQVPLKNHRDDVAGKIDLLAYDGRILRILELKVPHAKETMLRCILEGYTYLRLVDTKKLADNFKLPKGTKVEASPLVFWGSRPCLEMTSQDRPALKALAKELDCRPFYIEATNVKNPATWNIVCG